MTGWTQISRAAGSPATTATNAEERVDVDALLAEGRRTGMIARGAATVAHRATFDSEDRNGRWACGRCHRCRQGFHDTCLTPVAGSEALRDHELEMADPRRRAYAEAVAVELHRADKLMGQARSGTAQVVIGSVGPSRYER